jgi:hypothetical protein
MMKTTITRNGQTVNCYGPWQEDSNCSCIFEDEYLDGIWADGAANWTEAVEILTDYHRAHRAGRLLRNRP